MDVTTMAKKRLWSSFPLYSFAKCRYIADTVLDHVLSLAKCRFLHSCCLYFFYILLATMRTDKIMKTVSIVFFFQNCTDVLTQVTEVFCFSSFMLFLEDGQVYLRPSKHPLLVLSFDSFSCCQCLPPFLFTAIVNVIACSFFLWGKTVCARLWILWCKRISLWARQWEVAAGTDLNIYLISKFKTKTAHMPTLPKKRKIKHHHPQDQEEDVRNQEEVSQCVWDGCHNMEFN